MSSTHLIPGSPLVLFADALLQAEAAACRVAEGRAPRDFAGMFVDHPDVDRILSQLPGLDGPTRSSVQVGSVVDEARVAFEEWLSGDDLFPSIVRFARLDHEASAVLAVVVAVASDLRRQQLVCYIHDSVQLPLATPWLLRRLFPRPHPGPSVLVEGGSVWRAGLASSHDDGPFARRQIVPSDALLTALVAGGRQSAPPGSTRIGDDASTPGLTFIPGPDRVRRREMAAGLGSLLHVAPPADPADWERLVIDATVAGCGVFIDPVTSISEDLRRWVLRARHLRWVIGSPEELALDDFPAVPWTELPAGRGRVTGPDGWSLSATQDELARGAEAAFDGDRQRAVRRLVGGHLDRLATRIVPARGWDDLVLPHDEKAQLAELTGRYRHRHTVFEDWGFRAVPSSGIVALFAGPSGTGKTLAAEVVAGELDLDVFKIDLSSVVSKYIGETEKNISQVFDAAEAGRVLLFFDEADALFGKRSEVSDAHDRYANIEVSYLLQRLEAYDGLVVLATNFAKNIDQAFLRRIHVSVEFPLPDEHARLDIWTRCMPELAPVADLDLEFLARQFKLTGGSIRNAALAGAFLAAEDTVPIGMEHVVRGVRREFQKLGRLRTKTEFGPYFDLVEGSTNGGAHAQPVG